MEMKLEKGMPISLNDQVAHPDLMWPTPNRSDHLANQSETLEAWKKRAAEKKKEGINLQFALRHAAQMWPTPRASAAMSENIENIKKRDKDNSRLEEKVAKLWSTPVQDDVHHRKQKYSQGGTALSTQAGGSLNPSWVEWLMGYPGGYTDLKHWEILSSRKSSKRSATPSSKPKKKKT
jgi:hypothetical protein